jgi:thiol-disulfide isomerase/thioredoxin
MPHVVPPPPPPKAAAIGRKKKLQCFKQKAMQPFAIVAIVVAVAVLLLVLVGGGYACMRPVIRTRLAEPAAGSVRELEDLAQFEEQMKKPKSAILLYAEWCGHCRAFKPDLAKVAQNHPELNVAQVDLGAGVDSGDPRRQIVEAHGEQLGFMAFPTLYVFEGGKKTKEHVGRMNRCELERFLGVAMGSDCKEQCHYAPSA